MKLSDITIIASLSSERTRLITVRDSIATSTIQFTVGGSTFIVDSGNRKFLGMIFQFYNDQITDIETQLTNLGVELDA